MKKVLSETELKRHIYKKVLSMLNEDANDSTIEFYKNKAIAKGKSSFSLDGEKYVILPDGSVRKKDDIEAEENKRIESERMAKAEKYDRLNIKNFDYILKDLKYTHTPLAYLGYRIHPLKTISEIDEHTDLFDEDDIEALSQCSDIAREILFDLYHLFNYVKFDSDDTIEQHFHPELPGKIVLGSLKDFDETYRGSNCKKDFEEDKMKVKKYLPELDIDRLVDNFNEDEIRNEMKDHCKKLQNRVIKFIYFLSKFKKLMDDIESIEFKKLLKVAQLMQMKYKYREGNN